MSIFGWISAQALAQCALWLGLYAPLKLLLPLLADQLAQPGPGAREGLLAAATLAGSLVALVANPLAGALSDRQRGARGGRAAWILAGSLMAAIAIALLPGAGSALGLVGLWLLAKLGLNTCLAGVQGSAADRVPLAQQGSLWGWVGLAQPLGLVLGVAIGTLLLPRLQLAALALGALVPLACGPLLRLEWRAGAPLHRIRRQEARQPPREGSLLAPFRHPPFAGLWWSRFWLYLGWSMSTVYLLYFLEDRLGLPRPQALVAQALLLALYAGGTVASAALAGRASDRSGHRLGFVLVGSGGMAAACALFLMSQSLPLALLAATLLGV
ncbi:MAG: MFS transporter, partial [Cyanobacteriota bacterium]|nr:MFS transporter [Cyanobacteriota bacterium]